MTQIKRISTSILASHSDSNESIRVTRKKRDRNGVIPNHKQQGKNITKHHGTQRYCELCKKSGMPEQKYMSHSSEDCFGKHSNQNSIKYDLGGSLGSRVDDLKQYKSSKHKWKKYLKDFKKQKMIYRISKKSGSHRDLKNIKNTRAKASKKRDNSSSESSRKESYSGSYLSKYSD